MEDVALAAEVARVSGERTQRLIAMLRKLDDAALDRPSELPGWSRLTIVCHLRYGTHALHRMTLDALAGREASYYPHGRARQRPTTLHPAADEGPTEVLDDWQSAAGSLDRTWLTLDGAQWSTEVVEPSGNRDLGTLPLGRLALARLTEVDVHATDLAIEAPDWSSTLVDVGLRTRLTGLSSRPTDHRTFDLSIRGSWLLQASDGPRWLVSADDDCVESRPATEHDEAEGTIEGSSRDLLALLLGRPRRTPLHYSGDVAFARSFEGAFPGP